MVARMSAGILFIDLDGTLVGPDGIVERVWPALDALRAAGWRLAICTGRPGRGIALATARRLDPEGLHVFESGGVVMHGSGRVIDHHPLDPRAVTALAAVALAEDVTLEAYTADARFLCRAKDDFIRGHEALLGFEAELSSWPPADPLVRMQWVVPHARWPALASAAASAMSLVAPHHGRSPKMPGVAFVSMTAPGVSKGTGVRRVLAHLGLDKEHAAMAGDDLNDLSAFGEVGRTFAPEDGHQEVRARATEVIPSAARGGVADAAASLLEGSPTR